ncbi:uncharacterized protein PGTG_21374 [Puccinia graminis f. sp. tritici CRL 75-36-700-3]|uniref:Uncharacterized protein n=1 Tax=Puccinia graminis f. sp. tritici (strain CRL 75-36-700-3 / race SCCL) TaxID=418459 RepID=H6QRD4_PUCGT|nr:uncharacterized protein PGTG_21374 [Puccinia graminis f. sp. tritici CRL 75-36-700-3]EHS63223.1 hypothetical protein PGTG_21374 [Puccinia graminis f. sp. tritici CRL 75-36-700-3]
MSPATNSNQATPSNAVADNLSVKRLLVPADGSARAEEPAATALGGNVIAKPTEKGPAKRKTRAVKGKPSQTVANTGKKTNPTLPHVATGGGYVRDTLGEEAFLVGLSAPPPVARQRMAWRVRRPGCLAGLPEKARRRLLSKCLAGRPAG